MIDNQDNRAKKSHTVYLKREEDGTLHRYGFLYQDLKELSQMTTAYANNEELNFDPIDTSQIFARQVHDILPEVLKKIQRKNNNKNA